MEVGHSEIPTGRSVGQEIQMSDSGLLQIISSLAQCLV